MDAKMNTVKSDGAVIEYKVLKSGTAVAAKEGFGMVAAACGDVSALDRLGQPVAVMSLRGYGGSQVRGRTEGLDSYLADFDAMLDASGRKRSVLFGYSHAGYFATAYALRRPERVSGLVLVEPALYTDRDELLQRIKAADGGDGMKAVGQMLDYVQPEDASDEVAKRILGNVREAENMADEFRIRAEYPLGDELGGLSMPVLLVGGSDSKVADFVRRAAQDIPQACVWWVKGAQHRDLQQAQEISPVVEIFVSQLC